MKKILLIVLVWVAGITLFGMLALNRVNLQPDTAYGWIDSNRYYQPQSWNPVTLSVRWDANWYIDIARDGYAFLGDEKLSNIVFFPLYPLLTRAVSAVMAGNYPLAGWAVSIISLFFGCWYLYRLVREHHPELDPELPVMLMLIFPTAIFFTAVYAESLFFFLSVATVYYALKRNFVLASVFGFFAALARITGILLILPVAIEALAAFRQTSRWKNAYAWLALIPAGTALFFSYHWLRFGDFFLFLKVESWWGRMFSINADHLNLFSPAAASNMALDILYAASALILSIAVMRKLRLSYGVYMLATVLTALSTGTLMSIGRYVLVLFPMFIFLSRFAKQMWFKAYIMGSLLLLALTTLLFVNWYWAG